MKLFLNFKLVTETKNIIIYKYFRMVIVKTSSKTIQWGANLIMQGLYRQIWKHLEIAISGKYNWGIK